VVPSEQRTELRGRSGGERGAGRRRDRSEAPPELTLQKSESAHVESTQAACTSASFGPLDHAEKRPEGHSGFWCISVSMTKGLEAASGAASLRPVATSRGCCQLEGWRAAGRGKARSVSYPGPLLSLAKKNLPKDHASDFWGSTYSLRQHARDVARAGNWDIHAGPACAFSTSKDLSEQR